MLDESALKSYFIEAFRQITGHSKPPEIQVAFYPFAGLNHTIRIRKQKVYVRISEILRDAPQDILRSLAFILVSKLFNKEVMAEYHDAYSQYAYQPHILLASDFIRQKRGRKVLNNPVGKIYNLDQIFDRVNKKYFDNQLSKPILSWSSRHTKRIMGHYDRAHNAIVISRSLDDPDLPKFAIEFVLYFNMLYMKHPPQIQNKRRLFKTPEFNADVSRFKRYNEAWNVLSKILE